MKAKLLLINFVLLVLVAVCGLILMRNWSEFEAANGPGSPLDSAGPGSSEVVFEQIPPTKQSAFVDLQVVAEKNLFSPERRPEQAQDESQTAQGPPPFAKEPELHGTAAIGPVRVAFITEYTGRRGNKGVRTQVKVGDKIQEYTVARIERNSMTLRWNEHELLIEKTAGSPQRRPERTTVASGGVKIVTIGKQGPAVETTSPANSSQQEQQQGLTVATAGPQRGVGGQSNRGNRGNRQGLGNQRGLSGQRGNQRGVGGNRNPARGRGTVGPTNRRPTPTQRPPRQ